MSITREKLQAALERLQPWRGPYDIRKMPGGRVVRFVDWRRAAKGAARP